MSAFQVIKPSDDSVVYPNDLNLPTRILNPLIDYPKPIYNNQVYNQNIIDPNAIYNKVLPNVPVSLINALFHNQKKHTFNSKKVCVTSVKNELENTPEFKEAVEKYKMLENAKVICAKCQNNVNLISCFNYNNTTYICTSCALNCYNSIVELMDWERCKSDNDSVQCYRCDRLKHAKELYSFIRFSNKRSKYEVGNLCIYCRNVKRFEYMMKQRNKRIQNHKKSCFSQNEIKLFSTLRVF